MPLDTMTMRPPDRSDGKSRSVTHGAEEIDVERAARPGVKTLHRNAGVVDQSVEALPELARERIDAAASVTSNRAYAPVRGRPALAGIAARRDDIEAGPHEARNRLAYASVGSGDDSQTAPPMTSIGKSPAKPAARRRCQLAIGISERSPLPRRAARSPGVCRRPGRV